MHSNPAIKEDTRSLEAKRRDSLQYWLHRHRCKCLLLLTHKKSTYKRKKRHLDVKQYYGTMSTQSGLSASGSGLRTMQQRAMHSLVRAAAAAQCLHHTCAAAFFTHGCMAAQGLAMCRARCVLRPAQNTAGNGPTLLDRLGVFWPPLPPPAPPAEGELARLALALATGRLSATAPGAGPAPRAVPLLFALRMLLLCLGLDTIGNGDAKGSPPGFVLPHAMVTCQPGGPIG